MDPVEMPAARPLFVAESAGRRTIRAPLRGGEPAGAAPVHEMNGWRGAPLCTARAR